MSHHPLITLNQISKVYNNGTVALQDLNLAIPESQFVSLVGPSGCGKSTVLRLIAGLGRTSSGNIDWGITQKARKLAFVFQDAALMPWANVRENIRLPLKLARMSKKDSQKLVQQTLALVGLEGFEENYPRQLSGGMKMRVSIARALVTQPNVLLMDEPFGALDEITRSKLNGDLLNLWLQQRWTIVFVTHNIYEAVYLSKVVAFIAAAISGLLMAILFAQSKWIERSLFPYAVILQTTPIVAIAPLIILWLKNNTFAALVVCAWIVAFFPIVSNTTLGLNSVDRNLLNLFQLYKASRWQTLLYLRLPSAMPYFLGGLKISGGLALIGAVVAEFVAGTGGAKSGIAYRILISSYNLQIPRMFAALFLTTGLGVLIFVSLSALSDLILSKWHESAVKQEN